MKLKITKQKENPVLKRTEIEAELVFTGATPSKDAVSKEIASQMKASADVIDIKEIKSKFGLQFGKVTVYVYKDAASKAEMVKKTKPKKKAEAPKEEKKE
jgi:small subunit ribosomal protein S24e